MSFRDLIVPLSNGLKMAVRAYVTPGITLSTEGIAPRGTEAFVLVHGFMDNAGSFSKFAPLLVNQQGVSRVAYCVDCKGHGWTRWGNGESHVLPANTAIHFSDYVLDLKECLNMLNVSRFSLIGHSMGAGICSLLAAGVGHRGGVDRLIMLDSIGPVPECIPEKALQEWQDAVTFVAQKSEPVASIQDAAQRRADKNFIGKMDLEDALLLTERGVRVRDDGMVEWTYDPFLKRPSLVRFSVSHLDAIHRGVDVPALVIIAKDGLFAPMFSWLGTLLTQWGFVSRFVLRLLQPLAALGLLGATLPTALRYASRLERFYGLPQFTVRTVETGGHHLHLRNVRETHTVVEDFLSSHRPKL